MSAQPKSLKERMIFVHLSIVFVESFALNSSVWLKNFCTYIYNPLNFLSIRIFKWKNEIDTLEIKTVGSIFLIILFV